MTTRIGRPAWRAARDAAVWLAARPAPAVVIAGPDARRFCNGMFTNNVRDLAVGGTNRSALVDDRGRVGGFLDLVCEGPDRFVALLEDGLDAEGFLARYEKYVVFDDVTLAPADVRRVSVQGPGAAALLGRLGLPAPAAGAFAAQGGLTVLAKRRSPRGGFDVVGGDGATWPSPPGDAPVLGPGEAEALRVLAGEPRFPDDTGDKRLPHELGLRDALLSFDKGCYLGQETINRVDVMGDVKRRLVGVQLAPGEGPLGPGAEVRVGDQAIGDLTSPVAVGEPDDELWIGLSVVRRPNDAAGTEVIVAAPGADPRRGRVAELPFDP